MCTMFVANTSVNKVIFWGHIWMAMALIGVSQVAAQEKAAEKITYDDHAKPILVQRCSSCHNGQKREGDLDVTNYTNLMQGGGSGPVIEPLDASSSYLYKLITHEDSPEMPPSGVKIPDPQIKLLAQWIDMGALENKGSKAAKAKPKMSMALASNPNTRPEVLPTTFRIPLQPVITPKRSSILAMATNPWAPVLAVSTPKQILLYNTQTLELSGIVPFEEGAAHSLRFSRSGQLLLAGGGKDGAMGKAIIFHARTGERIASVGEELETVLASDISPNQEYIAYGGPGKLVKLVYTDGTPVAEIKKHTDWVTAIEFSPDGKYFATGDRSGGLYVWDGESGDPIYTLKGHTKQISEISWRSDGLFVASASEDTTIRLWEMKEGKQVKSWGAHGGGVTALEFCRDGNLVSAGRDKVAKLWDQNGKALKQFGGFADVAVNVSYCDETKRVFASDWLGAFKSWNAADGKQLADLQANPPTLQAKLATFNASLAQATKEHAPIQAQFAQVQSELSSMTKALNSANQSLVGLKSKMDATQKQLASTKQQLDATTAQHKQWRGELDLKNTKAKPALATSLAKAREALVALPNDADLKNTIGLLEGKLKQVDARITELSGLVAKSGEQTTTTRSKMNQLNQVVTTTQEEIQTTESQVKQLQGSVSAKTEIQKKNQTTLQQAQAKLAQAKKMVEQCKSDIAFIDQLAQLKQNLDAAQQQIGERQIAVDTAHKKLVAAQQEVDAAKQKQAVVVQQADSVREQIKKLRGQQ